MIIDALRHDIRFGIRVLIKNPTVSVVAILSLALSLTTSAVGLSIYNTLLFRVPEARDPDRLASLYTGEVKGDRYGNLSYLDYVFFRDNNRVYEDLAALPPAVFGVGLNYSGRKEMAMASLVTGNYFSMLGAQPMLGRTFTREDDESAVPLIVLSHALWTRLGADPAILGQSVTLNQHDYTVIGVAPSRFMGTMFGIAPDVWVPMGRQPDVIRQPDLLEHRGDRFLSVVGRLKPGVTLEQAQADITETATQLARGFPDVNRDRIATVRPARLISASMQPLVATIAGAFLTVVMLVLLVAAANFAILLVGLAAARTEELATRATLGATRLHLTRQLMVQSLIVALAGGTLGYGLAAWGLNLLSYQRIAGLLPIPIVLDFRPNLTVFLVTFGLTVLVGSLAGLLPSWQASKLSPTMLLRGESGAMGGRSRLRAALVAVQTMVCVLILAAAGLATRSLQNLINTDYGFEARALAAATLDFNLNNYSRERALDFQRQVKTQVAAIPGVQSVSLALGMPLGGSAWDSDEVSIPGYDPPDKERIQIPYSVVDEHYLVTLGIQLRAGRNFEERDTERSPEVVLVNEEMAQRYWPKQQVIGRHFRIVNGDRIVEIIGIAANGKYSDLDEGPRPFMYFTTRQHHQQYVNLVARTSNPPERVIREIERAIARVDDRFMVQIRTVDDIVATSLLMPVVTLSFLSAFGLMALVLAMSGLYAVVVHAVGQRRQEIGLRVALGADRQSLVWLLLRQGLILPMVGIVLGTAASLALTPILSSLFYQIRALEPLVLITTSAVVLGLAMLASCIAIWPWIRVDPMRLLRHS